MWILDRASGESLFPYEEVAVPPTPANAAFQHPWPTQPVSSIESLAEHVAEPDRSRPVRSLLRCGLRWDQRHMVFQPWAGGGMEWPPAAYSPRTHMFYSHASYSPS